MMVLTQKSIRDQRGFGIIEVMIALALGIIIMLGVTQIASNNSVIRYELDRTSRQMENAIFAIREIEGDLTSAGYWGELGEEDLINDDDDDLVIPPICPDEINEDDPHLPYEDELYLMMTFPVQGGSDDFDCSTVDTSDGDTVEIKDGSDFIAVRRASSCALGTTGCPPAGGNFHLQVEGCYDEEAEEADLPGNARVVAIIDDAPNFSVFEYQRRDCDIAATLEARAPIYRLLNRIYYINDDDELWRAELVGEEYEQTQLVDGVEMLRFVYGVDNSGDGNIDEGVNGYTLNPTFNYEEDPPVEDDEAFQGNWANVGMVRIFMVVRNVEPSPGYTDEKVYTLAGGEEYEPDDEFINHRRQLYVRTVSLRNVAGRRQ